MFSFHTFLKNFVWITYLSIIIRKKYPKVILKENIFVIIIINVLIFWTIFLDWVVELLYQRICFFKPKFILPNVFPKDLFVLLCYWKNSISLVLQLARTMCSILKQLCFLKYFICFQIYSFINEGAPSSTPLFASYASYFVSCLWKLCP